MAISAISSGTESSLVTRDGTRTIIWLEGEHDVATASVLTESLARSVLLGTGDLVVDLSGVTFFSVAAARALMHAHDVLERSSRRLAIRNPSPSAARVLMVCGLDTFVEFPPLPAR